MDDGYGGDGGKTRVASAGSRNGFFSFDALLAFLVVVLMLVLAVQATGVLSEETAQAVAHDARVSRVLTTADFLVKYGAVQRGVSASRDWRVKHHYVTDASWTGVDKAQVAGWAELGPEYQIEFWELNGNAPGWPPGGDAVCVTRLVAYGENNRSAGFVRVCEAG